MEQTHDVGRAVLSLVQGDITRQDTEAIANAANAGLLGGGGVDGAIHRAAGPALVEACREAKKALERGLLPTGQAVITPGFALRARYVIHCVGPIYEQAGAQAPRLLASCYASALALCAEHGIASIAFPSISTGVYGYPVDEAAHVALRTVRQALDEASLPTLVRFCLFDDRTFEAYARAAREILG